MSKDLRVNVLYAPGTNCHGETVEALVLALQKELDLSFDQAKSKVKLINLYDLSKKKARLDDCDLMVFPGGFSYGDHLGGGKILTVQVEKYAQDQVNSLIKKKIPVLGICNGFQLMTRVGLLPKKWYLTYNDSMNFQHGVAPIRIEKQKSSVWFSQIPDQVLLHYAHAEGRLVSKTGDYEGACLFYADGHNPNGSPFNVTGVISDDGLRLGLMPHPERNVMPFHQGGDKGILLFTSVVKYLLTR